MIVDNIPGDMGAHDVHNDVTSAATGSSPAARFAVGLLRLYKRFISPALPRACRFHPTCSEYALEAIELHGFLRGVGMAAVRLSKCHPFHKGGFDPVKRTARTSRPPG